RLALPHLHFDLAWLEALLARAYLDRARRRAPARQLRRGLEGSVADRDLGVGGVDGDRELADFLVEVGEDLGDFLHAIGRDIRRRQVARVQVRGVGITAEVAQRRADVQEDLGRRIRRVRALVEPERTGEVAALA